MSTASQRNLSFATEDDALVEIARLRRGYRKNGKWSLAQMAWHLVIPLDRFLNPPADPNLKSTPQQSAMKARFVDFIIANGKPPPHATTAPPDWTPPESAGDADIARFEAGLLKLKNYPHALVEMGPIGPVPIAECRRVHLVHIAHHLGFLEPTIARRTGLRYSNLDDVAKDVANLAKGYERTGNWSLPQICWHLNTAFNYFTSPPPYPDFGPVAPSARETLLKILANGAIPTGINAPEKAVPPATANETDIDAFLATLQRLKNFPGPYAPHRLFGQMTNDEAPQMMLIHCAHHFSYLVPMEKNA